MYRAVTRDIEVSVVPDFNAERSSPAIRNPEKVQPTGSGHGIQIGTWQRAEAFRSA